MSYRGFTGIAVMMMEYRKDLASATPAACGGTSCSSDVINGSCSLFDRVDNRVTGYFVATAGRHFLFLLYVSELVWSVNFVSEFI